MKLRTLDLFAGIGGITLGLERTGGFEPVGFCEIDKAAQKVLRKHWPNVPIFEDVKTLSAKDIDGSIDVITGGFPCQDISLAGKGAGLAGERSGLWFEYCRLIEEARPKWVIAENVSALRSRGLDQVLRSLSEIGYDAEWHCIPASAVGAPHRRDRVWIIAYPNDLGLQRVCRTGKDTTANISSEGSEIRGTPEAWSSTTNTDSRKQPLCWALGRVGRGQLFQGNGHWQITSEPFIRRGDDGFSGRMDRIKQLGNAVVPQIPELIGRAILQAS